MHTHTHNTPPQVHWRCQCTLTVVSFLSFSDFTRSTRNGGPEDALVFAVPNSTGACVCVCACVRAHSTSCMHVCACVCAYNHIRPYIKNANIAPRLWVSRCGTYFCWCCTASDERCVVDAARTHTRTPTLSYITYTHTDMWIEYWDENQAPKKHLTYTEHISSLRCTVTVLYSRFHEMI